MYISLSFCFIVILSVFMTALIRIEEISVLSSQKKMVGIVIDIILGLIVVGFWLLLFDPYDGLIIALLVSLTLCFASVIITRRRLPEVDRPRAILYTILTLIPFVASMGLMIAVCSTSGDCIMPLITFGI